MDATDSDTLVDLGVSALEAFQLAERSGLSIEFLLAASVCGVACSISSAFEAGGSFGESTEGTSTRFGVGAVGILGIAGGRMCGMSRTRIFPRTEVITFVSNMWWFACT